MADAKFDIKLFNNNELKNEAINSMNRYARAFPQLTVVNPLTTGIACEIKSIHFLR